MGHRADPSAGNEPVCHSHSKGEGGAGSGEDEDALQQALSWQASLRRERLSFGIVRVQYVMTWGVGILCASACDVCLKVSRHVRQDGSRVRPH